MQKSKAAIINDLSGLGRCSLVADITVLSAMGVQACPMPTAVLSAQTGFPAFSCLDMTGELPAFIGKWKELGTDFNGILTGYMTGEKQAKLVRSFIREFRTGHTTLLVDPVMADNGAGYSNFSPALCSELRAMAEQADIITPNVTELYFLAGIPCSEQDLRNPDPARLADIARSLSARQKQIWIITGLASEKGIANLLVTEKLERLFTSPRHGKNFSGTGDLFAAVVFGGILRGDKPEEAIRLAEHFLSASAASAVRSGFAANDGVDFESFLSMLAPESPKGCLPYTIKRSPDVLHCGKPYKDPPDSF